MSLSELVGTIRSRLADSVLALEERSPSRVWVTIRPEHIREATLFLFEEAGLMTDGAANALLKTLEEPTPSTVFVLVAESEDDLPS